MVTKKVFNAILTAKDLRREKWKAGKRLLGSIKDFYKKKIEKFNVKIFTVKEVWPFLDGWKFANFFLLTFYSYKPPKLIAWNKEMFKDPITFKLNPGDAISRAPFQEI